MRVLLCHNRYRTRGGEETSIDLLERGLAERGHEVSRFERDSSEIGRSGARRLGVAAGLAYRPGGGGIRSALDAFRPDVVHMHNTWPLLTPAAMRIARRRGARVVLTAHNYRFACPGGTLLRNDSTHTDCIDGSSLLCGLRDPRGSRSESLAYGLALEIQRRTRMMARWADAFIAPSAFMGRMLVRSGIPADRVRVIHHGVPPRPSRPSQRRHALFAGRLSAEKGVLTLLEAARRSSVPLVVAGSGPLADRVAAAGRGITATGPLPRAELETLVDATAFTVAPSEWYENCPYSVLESLAAGRAVIAADIGGLPELVDHRESGLLVRPGDPRGLADAMAHLWADPDRTDAMGRCGAAAAANRFDLGRQTAAVIDLYAELTVGRPRRSAGT